MRHARTVLIAISALLTAGCSVVKAPERPNWRVFALEPTPSATLESRTAPTVADGPVAIVAVPGSGAGYATRRMAYSRGAGELEYFADHRWADTPARMLVPLFQEALTRTGVFSAVAAMPTRARGDFMIESEVLVFRQELSDDGAHFRAVVRVTLVGTGAQGTLASRVFDVTEPMEISGPTEGVVAANRAIARLLSEAAAFCAESPRTTGTSP